MTDLQIIEIQNMLQLMTNVGMRVGGLFGFLVGWFLCGLYRNWMDGPRHE